MNWVDEDKYISFRNDIRFAINEGFTEIAMFDNSFDNEAAAQAVFDVLKRYGVINEIEPN